jgi:hypothetical protein
VPQRFASSQPFAQSRSQLHLFSFSRAPSEPTVALGSGCTKYRSARFGVTRARVLDFVICAARA